jgi:hypothetical protein
LHSDEVLAFVEATVLGAPPPRITEEDEKKIKDWRPFADPNAIHRLREFERRSSRMPVAHRTLPTSLGNALRASEDVAAQKLGGSVEGMIRRVYHHMPGHLQDEFDEFRNRLGLYASLAVVTAVLGVVASVATWDLNHGQALLLVAGSVAGVWLFYRAAVSSAAALGGLLIEIADVVTTEGLLSRPASN